MDAPRKKIVLITTLYDACKAQQAEQARQAERRRQIEWTIRQNVESSFFDKTVIVYERTSGFAESPEAQFVNALLLREPEKVYVIHVSTRPTYKMLFDIANDVAYEPIVACIANTDILFDASVKRLHEGLSEGCVAAITRWAKMTGSQTEERYRLQLQCGRNGRAFSFDTYAFASPHALNTERFKDICVGVAGCDNLLVKRLVVDCGVRVINPCLDVRTFHIDDERRHRDLHENYYRKEDYPIFRNTKADAATILVALNGVRVGGLDYEADFEASKVVIMKRK